MVNKPAKINRESVLISFHGIVSRPYLSKC